MTFKRGDTFLAPLKCAIIKIYDLSREHFCPESNSPKGQCLLQDIYEKFEAVSLFNNMREELKKWAEVILERCFKSYKRAVPLDSHLSLKQNLKELIPK